MIFVCFSLLGMSEGKEENSNDDVSEKTREEESKDKRNRSRQKSN